MQKASKPNSLQTKDRCAVCGSSLTNGVCPSCGWVQILFPRVVPSEIGEFNARRKEAARQLHREANDSKGALAKTESALADEKYKNESLRQELSKAKNETRTAKSETESLKKKLVNADKNLAALGNKSQGLAADVQRLSSRNKALKDEVARVKAELSSLKQNPPSANGAQIRIEKSYGKYKLYDAAGVVRRDNGTVIGKSGIELYDGCAFDIDELSFRVSAPEFDLDNLVLD